MEMVKENGEQGGHSSSRAIWKNGMASYSQPMAWFRDRSSSGAFIHPLNEIPVPAQHLTSAQNQTSAGASNGFINMPTPKAHASSAHSDQQLQNLKSSALHSTMSECFLPYNQAYATFPYPESFYGGILAAYGGPTSNRIPLPLDMSEDGPVYVNAKQYHGILRRRQSRAKAELENKIIKVRKPYLHESRHLHAMRRLRGCGGRFLNTKKIDGSRVNSDDDTKHEEQQSEFVTSSGSSFNHENEKLDSNDTPENSSILASEVTSMSESYHKGITYNYTERNGTHSSSHFNFLGFNSISSGIDGSECGQGIGCAFKWITTDSCCDPMKG